MPNYRHVSVYIRVEFAPSKAGFRFLLAKHQLSNGQICFIIRQRGLYMWRLLRVFTRETEIILDVKTDCRYTKKRIIYARRRAHLHVYGNVVQFHVILHRSYEWSRVLHVTTCKVHVMWFLDDYYHHPSMALHVGMYFEWTIHEPLTQIHSFHTLKGELQVQCLPQVYDTCLASSSHWYLALSPGWWGIPLPSGYQASHITTNTEVSPSNDKTIPSSLGSTSLI